VSAVRLRAGDYAATFRPDAGMTGTSLHYRDVEHVVRPEPLGRLRVGVMTGISLMHPWANRLGARRYRAADRTVDLTAVDLPTGARTPVRRGRLPLAGTSLDDHFALRSPTAISIGEGERRVTVRFGIGYGYAQVYAPARRRFVAIEPMTAPIDGLRTGTTPSVAPGEQFTAGFTIAVGAD